MPKQFNVRLSDADYQALRSEAFTLDTTMSALVRLRLGHPQVTPAMKVQSPALVEDDEDLPPKPGVTE